MGLTWRTVDATTDVTTGVTTDVTTGVTTGVTTDVTTDATTGVKSDYFFLIKFDVFYITCEIFIIFWYEKLVIKSIFNTKFN